MVLFDIVGRKGKLFSEVIEDGRQAASRSILIKQHNPAVLPFSRTKKYITFKSGNRYFALVEFRTYDEVLNVLQTAQHFGHVKNVPVTSRFLFDNLSYDQVPGQKSK